MPVKNPSGDMVSFVVDSNPVALNIGGVARTVLRGKKAKIEPINTMLANPVFLI